MPFTDRVTFLPPRQIILLQNLWKHFFYFGPSCRSEIFPVFSLFLDSAMRNERQLCMEINHVTPALEKLPRCIVCKRLLIRNNPNKPRPILTLCDERQRERREKNDNINMINSCDAEDIWDYVFISILR